MQQVSKKAPPSMFLSKSKKPLHFYLTRFFIVSYIKLTHKRKKCKYQISIRGPYLRNEFLIQTEKEIESIFSFKIVVKHKLLSLYNE